jgi:hypothetical protein
MSWGPILATLGRLAALAVIVQTGTIWVCARWFWTPIQRHYLPAYLRSSLPVIAPSIVEARLIWKTKPNRKPELATEDDAVLAESTTGMELSPWARGAGWTGLIEGPPRQLPSAKLASGLADLAFEGESLEDFLFLPEVCAMTVFCLALFGSFCLKAFFRGLVAELAWRRRSLSWKELAANLFEECAELARKLSSRLAGMHRTATRRIETHPAATIAKMTLAKHATRPASFAFPLFGIHSECRGGYLWTERDEIE